MIASKALTVLVPLTELGAVTAYTGGVGNRYAATLPWLGSNELTIVVVLLADSPVGPAQGNSDFLKSVEVKNVRWLAHLPWRARTILRPLVMLYYVVRESPDLVYSPEWTGAASLLPKRYPIITNLVASSSLIEATTKAAGKAPTLLGTLNTRLQSFLENRQIKRSIAVFGCSQAVIDWNFKFLGGDMPADRIVVRNCIDVDRVAQLSREASPPDAWPEAFSLQKVVLFAGRLEVRKGVDLALGAFIRLAQERNDLRFVFAGGEGDLAREPGIDGLVERIPSEVRDRFAFLGAVSSSGMYACMSRSALVVCPSRWEAFGNIALEAKASGTAVLVTSGSGFAEFCTNGEDAIVVEPNSVEAIHDGCIAVLDNPDLADRITRTAREGLGRFRGREVAIDLRREFLRRCGHPETLKRSLETPRSELGASGESGVG